MDNGGSRKGFTTRLPANDQNVSFYVSNLPPKPIYLPPKWILEYPVHNDQLLLFVFHPEPIQSPGAFCDDFLLWQIDQTFIFGYIFFHV